MLVHDLHVMSVHVYDLTASLLNDAIELHSTLSHKSDDGSSNLDEQGFILLFTSNLAEHDRLPIAVFATANTNSASAGWLNFSDGFWEDKIKHPVRSPTALDRVSGDMKPPSCHSPMSLSPEEYLWSVVKNRKLCITPPLALSDFWPRCCTVSLQMFGYFL